MHILCLGLNHQTANIHLREQLSFQKEAIKAALARLGCGRHARPAQISEMVILSTCNRVEVYAVDARRDFSALENFLSEVRDVPVPVFSQHLYRLADEEAVEHLLQVAAGLDSMVLGEPQILGQVMQALELSRGQNAAGPILSRLFQTVLHAGKRVRTETAISQNPGSIASVAVNLAGRAVPNLAAARVAVLGAGEMAELTVEALRKRGVSEIHVINRTLDRAQQLAGRWGGQASTFERLPEAMQWADILITSTGAPHLVVEAHMVADSLPARQERALVIIDIAVPRDVETEAGELPGVRLYDMDALQTHLGQSLAQREEAVPQAQVILAEEHTAFNEYLALLDVFPLIAEMHQRAETIRQAELDKTLRHLPELSEAERQRLEALTLALVKKILRTPIVRLRMAAGGPQAVEYATAARTLFDLECDISPLYAMNSPENLLENYL